MKCVKTCKFSACIILGGVQFLKHLSDDFRALFLRHIPLSRIGLPEEIAEAVVYFASDESAYTTGQILSVSGGFGLATPVYGDLASKDKRR